MRDIINALQILIQFLVSSLRTIADLVLQIPKMLAYLIRLLSIVPPIYTTLATGFLAIYVLYLFLGRGGGKGV